MNSSRYYPKDDMMVEFQLLQLNRKINDLLQLMRDDQRWSAESILLNGVSQQLDNIHMFKQISCQSISR
jgi:hypothetical protein